MPEDLRRTFKRQGYVLLKGVLSAAEVAAIRARMPADFAKLTRKPKQYMQARECLEVPEVYRLMAHPRIVAACKEIFGDELVYVNDLVVQRNVLPPTEITPHLDCQAEYRFLEDRSHLLNPDFLFAKVGIYLQDNTPENGGGIDIFERGHRFMGNGVFFRYQIYKRILRPLMARRMKRMETKAGDVLIFDSRLPHRPTFAAALSSAERKDGQVAVPEELAKYTIYWEVTKAGDEKPFVTTMMARAKKEEMKRPPDTYRPRCSYLGLVYPDDYPADLVEALREHNVTMFSLGREEADSWTRAATGQEAAR
jgi:hypothetical protein